MNFTTLDPETFREFALKSPYKSFMQTPEIAKYREENGWTPYYFGAEEDGKLIAATMLVAKPTFLGKSTYFAPGGPLLDYENTALTNFFFKNLKNYIKSHNGYVLHINPYYELTERDREGEPKEGGFNHQKALKNLKNLGFQTITTDSMPKYLFVLKLNDRTPDQLFADLKRNTRNHIRKAEKMGVTIRELKREELSIFKQITESTSQRRNFTDQPLSYYDQMYNLFHDKGEVKFVMAGVPEDTLSRSIFADGANTERPSPVTTGARERSEKDVSLVPLSVAMFMLYGDEIIYLFSGSDEKYMRDYNAQYLIQWYMIKYAAEHGFKTYNFYGINGLPNKSDKDYGIYDFKKGFTSEDTGKVIELIGSYELPVNQLFYQLHHLLSKLKSRK